jgi:hypothetical protein
VAQDDAAKADIGLHVEQLGRIAIANHTHPKGHDLHVATRTHAADGIFAEIALDSDQAHHHRGVNAGTLAFVPYGLQKLLTGLKVSLLLDQPVAHGCAPAQIFQTAFSVFELGHGRCAAVDSGAER